MSKKTLNKINLAALGADRLADLLLEVSTGSADIKRRLRLELSHNIGASELAHEVRKRLVALRKSKAFVGWRKRKALIKDLNTQVTMIIDKISPDDPIAGFDLLWQFIEIAPSVFERVDDNRGDIGDVFRDAIAHFEQIGPRASLDRLVLADRVWTAISDNGFGEWDGIISLLAPTLGADGLACLKSHIEQFAVAPLREPDSQHEAFQFLRDLRGERDYRVERRDSFVKRCLQEIAAASGDTDFYIAQFTTDDLRCKTVAAEVATLLLEENQAKEALRALLNVDQDGGSLGQEAWDDAYIATLTALGQTEDAQSHLWACFEARLSVKHLRAFLKALPDFADVEAEDRAKAYVLSYPDILAALHFCLDWPALLTASQLIETRAHEIDGNYYEILTPAAETLSVRYPLAAVLLWRAMIDFALEQGRSSRYGHAADHLTRCAALDPEIADYGPYRPHQDYLQTLETKHDRKTSFWAKLR